MTKVSRYKLGSEKRNSIFNDFSSIVTLLDDKKQIGNFFKSLLTRTEIEMISKRIQIAKMLLEGHNYQDIKSSVNVTDSTISRISNLLALEDNGLEIAIKKLNRIYEESENRRMGVGMDLKKRYPSYFLPEIIIDKMEETGKKIKRKSSVKHNI